MKTGGTTSSDLLGSIARRAMLEALVRHGMIDRKDLGLFQFADDPATALALLQGTLQAQTDEGSPCFAQPERGNRTTADRRARSNHGAAP
jgi:hypothetical protein